MKPRAARPGAGGLRRALGVLVLVLAPACARPPPVGGPEAPDYHPDRRDYFAYRAAHPGILEPNYLPFMAHRVRHPDGRDVLVFCRWDSKRFPLRVAIDAPAIPDSLQDEFDPTPVQVYAGVVAAALDTWERSLEGLVRFRRVPEDAEADLRVRLHAAVAPAPDSGIAVLGTTSLGRACRVRGVRGPDALDVEFDVPELQLYLADEYGLLTPDQVYRVALHELGHALGMRGHSPVPGDLMFPIARDSLSSRSLSEEDANSFVSLYAQPPGSIFLDLSAIAGREPWPGGPPPGPPRLAAAPHVDARFGYELRPPEGWTRIESERGMIATDGVAWDYDATFQVIVRSYDRVADYLARHEAEHVGGGRVLVRRRLVAAGHPAVRLVIADRIPGLAEEETFIESGDGRVVVVIADCSADSYPRYRPWFRAVLDTLEIRPSSGP